MAEPPKAIVIGLASVTGLQTARILAARGVPVIGIAGNRRHFAARTRVCEQILQSDVHGDGFLETLEKLGPDLAERAVLYPCTDQAVLAISARRDRLRAWYHVRLPDDAVVRTLAHKATFYEHAHRHGLPVPTSVTLTDRATAQSAATAITYPAVLKPSVKTPTWKRHAGVKVWPVTGPEQLLAAYDRLRPWADTLVAQEYVDGPDDQLYTCNCYYDAEHRPLVTFTTRKRRQWPPHVGTASYGEECRNDRVVAETLRAFGTVDFAGLGYLEMKYDAATDRHLIMEANIGRPTGRSATAEAGGVELLYTMYCEAVGLPLPEAEARQQHFTGAAWIDLRRDLLAATHYWRRRELRASDWIRSLSRPKTHAVLSLSDPAPFLFELAQSARKATRRLLRRAAAGVTPAPADE